MFSSTIIPTINRQTLDRTVKSVLDQDFVNDDFEIIVVNDSGGSLPEADWQKSSRVKIINTNRRERSVARNTGAAIARGRYLHFLDDDDILLPGALQSLWEVYQKDQDADWLYGGWRSVNNSGERVEEFTPQLSGRIFIVVLAGESLPLQACLVKAETFFRIGGFDTDPELVGVEDRDLGRRLALHGRIAHTTFVVAHVRIGEMGSTTNWKTIAQSDRLSREKTLHSALAFQQLRQAKMDNFWRGRISRAYLASSIWNLQRGYVLSALSRLINSITLMGLNFFAPRFWVGLRTKPK